MGIALSVLRCCLCLDDDNDDGISGRADRRVLNPYTRITEPPLAWTHSSDPASSARARVLGRLPSTDQPAVATPARSSPRLAAYTNTATRAGGPAPPRSATSSASNPATPAGTSTTHPLPAPRLQQQAPVQSRGPSSSSAISPTPSCNTASPVPPAISSNQLPRTSLRLGSVAAPNPAPPATSTPWRSQAPVAGGSTSAAVGTRPLQRVQAQAQGTSTLATSSTPRVSRVPAAAPGGSTSAALAGPRPVKREVTTDVPTAAEAQALYSPIGFSTQQAASHGAETRDTQSSKHWPAEQSNRSQVLVERVRVAVPRMLDRGAEKPRNGSPKTPIPVYEIPPNLREMIQLDKVPAALKHALSTSNYSEYFACLLYAEDFYLEKWSKYLLRGVTLEFQKQSSSYTKQRNGIKYPEKRKDYVAFEIDSVHARRPFILSRDFVFLQPLVANCQRIQGRVVRVQNSTKVLAEFEDDFWSQHSPEKRYDVSFSFNRVCLKRAHHAVANALGPLLFGFLFPEEVHKAMVTAQKFFLTRPLQLNQANAGTQITDLKGFPPYLIVGPPCMKKDNRSLTNTGVIIRDAIIQVYRAQNKCRILICTPRNITCDTLLKEVSKEINESQQFRANAAFRDYEDVPDDILPSCQFNDANHCFTCPPLHELHAFKAVTSTYMSSFRLRQAGIKPGHFTHIFLVDASAVAEPEAVVPLANLASEDTAVVISGSELGFPWYVRSDMARRWGLKTSYFHRLLQRELYKNNPFFVFRLNEEFSSV